ncbi:molybdenum import ATP-binding protein ModC [Mycolicibacterium madagascariense]|uniref:Molybdenum import ATP-binding protein ModC n=1 Tax=Mycolicibacterium madagascariense TaxID=212765 RepID=A0A7I7XHT1_9MYCO|nr:ATP-binding cassette domain-containing protein [Mycolicibacterium madagascariense]MCV7014308.1 ATP-binding cassette domain-containing protein [Mycolicibacterium madagascariense]BBZ28734.1 molybdenum import ATP-binding protein ModC [Mycolicibacterium madagascariense]
MSGLDLRAVVAHRDVDVEFSVAAGEVLAVLGPNGAGKSTVLQVIAGLVRPDGGAVRVGDRVLTDTATGVAVDTHDRRVGLLMQDGLLFPHLSAIANVAFGARNGRRATRRDARAAATHWLGEVEAADLADRAPRQLSGGQARRVALARALAAEPDVLLLDEPLTGLDVGVASAMRRVLRRVLARDGRCSVLVTHDLLDVVTLADHVVVLEAGRVVESGRTAAVLAAPRSHFGARFAGVNLVSGRAGPNATLVTDSRQIWHGREAADVTPGDPVVATFHPSAVAVYRDPPHGSPRNTVEVVVAELDGRGPAIRVRAEDRPDGSPGLSADITAESAAELRLGPGERVYFAVKAQEVTIHAVR